MDESLIAVFDAKYAYNFWRPSTAIAGRLTPLMRPIRSSADAIVAGRRERKDVPVAEESMQEIDYTFDTLVVEALRPLDPPTSSVESLRALTDLEVWRSW